LKKNERKIQISEYCRLKGIKTVFLLHNLVSLGNNSKKEEDSYVRKIFER